MSMRGVVLVARANPMHSLICYPSIAPKVCSIRSVASEVLFALHFAGAEFRGILGGKMAHCSCTAHRNATLVYTIPANTCYMHGKNSFPIQYYFDAVSLSYPLSVR